MVRYRFSEFTLSPQRRLLIRDGQEVPLIPKYFDLLLLLVERRREAVHRREIFDRVWADAIVSESALSQAVRTIRRTLGDDPRESRFIRTVSRHGYQFVYAEVVEEQEEGAARSHEILPAPASPPDDERVQVTRAGRVEPKGWIDGAAGGGLAGITAGAIGGLILAAAPESTAPIAIAPVLAVVGGVCGGLGGAGIGAGLDGGERITGVPRAVALALAAALGGGLVGFAVQWLTRWALSALVGLDIAVGGGLEGLLIGAAAGLGYALATTRPAEGEPAVPRSGQRFHVAVILAVACGLAGLTLNLAGRPLVSGTINALAHAAEGSRARLAPLGRLVGEPDFGPVSSAIVSLGEAALFGIGLAYGLTRRR